MLPVLDSEQAAFAGAVSMVSAAHGSRAGGSKLSVVISGSFPEVNVLVSDLGVSRLVVTGVF